MIVVIIQAKARPGSTIQCEHKKLELASLATPGPRSSKLVKSYVVWHSKGLVFYATLNACPMIYCL